MVKILRLQIIGFGFIGKNLVKTLYFKKNYLKEKYGLDYEVVSITDLSGTVYNEKGLDLKDFLNIRKVDEHEECIENMRGLDAIKEIDADIVFELTPSNIKDGEPGLSHIKTALNVGKHVITSNKGPLVVAFKELKELSKRKNLELRFEASVGGAMHVISTALETLAGCEIYSIQGILNGTTNYILSRMTKEEMPLNILIREAQEMGIAERDPSYDIDGIDTACKLVILANEIMKMNITIRDVKRIEGIRKVTPEIIKLAKEKDYVIKLIGEVSKETIEVSPRLVSKYHPMNVDGVLNAVLLKTDLAGDILLIGKGAGEETISSLISDLIKIYRRVSI